MLGSLSVVSKLISTSFPSVVVAGEVAVVMEAVVTGVVVDDFLL